jgi:DMSO/TMAO reductase YedYZ molybdopterin-dependent catalytic subunit
VSGLDRRVLLGLVDRAVDGALARSARLADARPGAVTRRQLIGTLARTSGSALAAAYGASILAACGSHGPDAAQAVIRSQSNRNETVERWLFRHTAMDHARGPIAGAAFPNYHVAPAVPVWDAAADGPWALEVAGLVERPLRLTLDDLQRLPRVSQRVNHYCVEGWNAVATWQGVRVSELARLAGARPEARYVDFRSFDVETPGKGMDDAKRDPNAAPAPAAGASAGDSAAAGAGLSKAPAALRAGALSGRLRARGAGRDYHESWDVESAMHPQTLVAYGRDGHLLSAAYGAPARLHSPVKLGYKNTKYLTRVVFMRERNGGYWTDAGYEWYAGT